MAQRVHKELTVFVRNVSVTLWSQPENDWMREDTQRVMDLTDLIPGAAPGTLDRLRDSAPIFLPYACNQKPGYMDRFSAKWSNPFVYWPAEVPKIHVYS